MLIAEIKTTACYILNVLLLSAVRKLSVAASPVRILYAFPVECCECVRVHIETQMFLLPNGVPAGRSLMRHNVLITSNGK